MTLGKKLQKDKDKEMENIIEERKKISKKIVEFQNKYKRISPDDEGRSSAFGIAMRITTDLISGVIIGGIMGWSLDKMFGTEPWLLIIFFVFGVFAGISNVIRTANKMNKLGFPCQVSGTCSGTIKNKQKCKMKNGKLQ